MVNSCSAKDYRDLLYNLWCSAYNCTQRYRKGSGISFFSFPSDSKLRSQWVLAMKRENFEPTNSSVLCSKHFLESDVVRQFGQIKLREGSIPSIFDFPEHLKKKTPKPRKIRKRLAENFYSTSAYNYVRCMFSNCLPHPKTLSKWYKTVDGSPGYTTESLRAIELKTREMKKEEKTLICNLVMDEMSIRKHIQWNGRKQVGYINYGYPMESESLPEAKEALVFLIVALNSRWKLPIAYFLVNGLGAEEKANMVRGCLTMLDQVGVKISSITFDGAATNLSMAIILGAKLCDFNNIQSYFAHPITKEPVYIILDAVIW